MKTKPKPAALGTALRTILRAAMGVGSVLAVTVPASADTSATAAPPTPRACHVPGVSDRALCHAIRVPLHRDGPAAEVGTLDLHVVVLPARAPKPADSPLFVLAGGPGQAATEYGALVSGFLEGVRETRDIVLMDQRGTGKSGGLSCDIGDDPEAALDPSALGRVLAGCRARWNADLTAYDTLAVVEDIEAVRKALGYARLDLWGASWGTRTALLYMRAHPASVRSAVLDGVTPPNRRLLEDEPGFSQAALDATFAACAADASCAATFPDQKARFKAWLAGFDRPRDFTDRRPDATDGTARLTREAVAQAIRGALYTAQGAARIPFAVERLMAGDATALVTMAANLSGTAESMYLGATLSSLCREEVQRTPAAALAAPASGSFTGASWYGAWADACRDIAVRPLPQGYDAPVATDIPVLILSGALDPITPPPAAEAAKAHLSRSWHVVAPATGHNVTVARCADRVVADFVKAADGSALDTACLRDQKRPAFMVGANGPTP